MLDPTIQGNEQSWLDVLADKVHEQETVISITC